MGEIGFLLDLFTRNICVLQESPLLLLDLRYSKRKPFYARIKVMPSSIIANPEAQEFNEWLNPY